MKAYVGQTRSRTKAMLALLRSGIGEATCRGEYPPYRLPWFYDNGAFRDWTAGKTWDVSAWLSEVQYVITHDPRPDFVVAPDVVGGGLASLRVSLHWVPVIKSARVFLAVQDGMKPKDIEDYVTVFDGIFIGGTLPWKLRTGCEWVQWAHSRDLPCHIGRCGTPKRVRWAKDIGADSIDSCLPLWTKQRLREFIYIVTKEDQITLWPDL